MRRFLCRAVPLLVVSLAAPAVAVPAGPARDVAVLEAVFRQQIAEHLDATDRARGTIVCFGIEAGSATQSPDRDFMARFASEKSVRPFAACERRPEGAVERTTAAPAVIVTAGPIEWIAADEAWVAVRYYRTRLVSAVRRYRVVREKSGWVSLGPIIKDGPV